MIALCFKIGRVRSEGWFRGQGQIVCRSNPHNLRFEDISMLSPLQAIFSQNA